MERNKYGARTCELIDSAISDESVQVLFIPPLYSAAWRALLVSIKNAPSGAVMTMPSTATDSTCCRKQSPAASGTGVYAGRLHRRALGR